MSKTYKHLKSKTTYFVFASLLFWCFLAVSCNKTTDNTTQQQGQGQRGGGGRGANAGPVSVAVATVSKQDVPVYLNGLGNVTAFNTVGVKSRIDGQLTEVHFKEGDYVKQNDLLAMIDSRPYDVQLSQMQAQLFKDQASLKDAQLNLDRFNAMVKDGILAPQQRDTQQSLVDQLQGAIRSDQAQIDNVKLQITYCHITAPISGRIGLRQVDAGNIVHASDPNPMVVITQQQPIAVIFTLPEDVLPTVAGRMRSTTLHVDAYDRADQNKLAAGTLVTIDNEIDTTTGTGKLKAVFDNKNNELWPNQFVNVHMLIETRNNSIVVPTVAIQRGPQGTYTYVMKQDKKVDMRPVKVALTQGDTTIVGDGLEVGEIVVVDGQDKLSPNSTVEPRGAGAPGSGGPGGGRHKGGDNNANADAAAGTPAGSAGGHGHQPGGDKGGKAADAAPAGSATDPAPAGGKHHGAGNGQPQGNGVKGKGGKPASGNPGL